MSGSSSGNRAVSPSQRKRARSSPSRAVPRPPRSGTRRGHALSVIDPLEFGAADSRQHPSQIQALFHAAEFPGAITAFGVQETIKSYYRSIRENVVVPDIYLEQAEYFEDVGEIQLATDAYRRAISLEPDRSKGYLALARMFAESRRHADAIAVCLEAIERISDATLLESITLFLKECQKNAQLVSKETGYTDGVKGETTTPPRKRGSSEMRRTLPLPEAGHELTHPQEGTLAGAVAALLSKPRARSVIELLRRDPEALFRAADEILRRIEAVAPGIFRNLPEGLARPYSKDPVPDEVLTPENIATAHRIQNARKRRKPEAELIDAADLYLAGRIIRAHQARLESGKSPALG